MLYQKALFSAPVIAAGFTFLITFVVLFNGPLNSLGNLWLYAVFVDNLGNALPLLTPSSPSSVGLPDVYYVGLWSYCAQYADTNFTTITSSCPTRSWKFPVFFFNLRDQLLNDMVTASVDHDVRANIFLLPSIYGVTGPASVGKHNMVTVVQVLAAVSTLAFCAGFVSSAISLAQLVRNVTVTTKNSNLALLHRSVWFTVVALLVAAVSVTIETSVIVSKLCSDIALGYGTAVTNVHSFLIFWSGFLAALVTLYLVNYRQLLRVDIRRTNSSISRQQSQWETNGGHKFNLSTSASGWLSIAGSRTGSRSPAGTTPISERVQYLV
ncbi:hypothetical protein V1514DRAFT_319571 [Lipomyces japonicus]|uniref:uncharacterized protein n=1 Tax=Lipomyces japonicus TaxID=56871 RepID=UPI0034CDE5DF